MKLEKDKDVKDNRELRPRHTIAQRKIFSHAYSDDEDSDEYYCDM